MTAKNESKEFDAVEMKRRASRAIYERLKDMDRDERLDYWRERTDALRRRQGDLETSE